MNRKRLGQCLIGGVFTACGLVIAALAELAAKAEAQAATGKPAPEESESSRRNQP